MSGSTGRAMSGSTGRPLSLAAATLTGCTPEESLEIAASTGYQMAGVRPGATHGTVRDARQLRSAAGGSGLVVLDVEVVRIGTTSDTDTCRLLDFAAELGALHLLVVMDHEVGPPSVDRLAELCRRSEGSSVRPVLEFMRFTAVPTLAAALSVVDRVGHPRAGVLVDPLHLARSGGQVADLAAAGERFCYVQLCDAPALAPVGGTAGLVTEARHHRLLPGEGALPLRALLDAIPDVPVSVEVPSDEGWASRTPRRWAAEAHAAASAIVGAGCEDAQVAGD